MSPEFKEILLMAGGFLLTVIVIICFAWLMYWRSQHQIELAKIRRDGPAGTTVVTEVRSGERKNKFIYRHIIPPIAIYIVFFWAIPYAFGMAGDEYRNLFLGSGHYKAGVLLAVIGSTVILLDIRPLQVVGALVIITGVIFGLVPIMNTAFGSSSTEIARSDVAQKVQTGLPANPRPAITIGELMKVTRLPLKRGIKSPPISTKVPADIVDPRYSFVFGYTYEEKGPQRAVIVEKNGSSSLTYTDPEDRNPSRREKPEIAKVLNVVPQTYSWTAENSDMTVVYYWKAVARKDSPSPATMPSTNPKGLRLVRASE